MRDITVAPSSTDWLADKHQAEQRNRSRGVSLIMRNQFTDRHGQLPKGLGSRFTIGSKVMRVYRYRPRSSKMDELRYCPLRKRCVVRIENGQRSCVAR